VTFSSCSKLRVVSLLSCALTAGQASNAANDSARVGLRGLWTKDAVWQRRIMRVACFQGDRCNRGDESATIWSLMALLTVVFSVLRPTRPLSPATSFCNTVKSFTVGATLICANAPSTLPLLSNAATLTGHALAARIGTGMDLSPLTPAVECAASGQGKSCLGG
jgi:hypothetical protein